MTAAYEQTLAGLEMRFRRSMLTRARLVVVCLRQLLDTLRTPGVHAEVVIADREETVEALRHLALALSPVEYWRTPAYHQARAIETAGVDSVPAEVLVSIVEDTLQGWETWVLERDVPLPQAPA